MPRDLRDRQQALENTAPKPGRPLWLTPAPARHRPTWWQRVRSFFSTRLKGNRP